MGNLLIFFFPIRYTKDRSRFQDVLEIVKFICKDYWTDTFRKQIDNLKTNHRVKNFSLITFCPRSKPLIVVIRVFMCCKTTASNSWCIYLHQPRRWDSSSSHLLWCCTLCSQAASCVPLGICAKLCYVSLWTYSWRACCLGCFMCCVCRDYQLATVYVSTHQRTSTCLHICNFTHARFSVHFWEIYMCKRWFSSSQLNIDIQFECLWASFANSLYLGTFTIKMKQ